MSAKTAEKKSAKTKTEEKFSGAIEASESKNDSETEFLTSDAKGNEYLPTMEVPVPKKIKPIIDLVKQIEGDLKPAFASARDNLVAAQDRLSEHCHKNIEHFTEPDENGTRIYKSSGIEVKITFEKEKIKTAMETDD
jgi:hypothetical protein